jgi:hypothetical protein
MPDANDPPLAIPYASSAQTRARSAPKSALFLQSLVGIFLTLLGLILIMVSLFTLLFAPMTGVGSAVTGTVVGAPGLLLAALGVLKLVYMLRYRGLIKGHEEHGQTFAEKMIRRW